MSLKVALTIIEGPDVGQSFDLGPGITTIGRNDVDIVLNDKKVSSSHCEIEVTDKKTIVRDTGSTNGTFVGGHKLQGEVELQNLDTLTIGLTNLSVAVIEELADFKRQNALSKIAEETQQEVRLDDPISIPEEGAEYQDTGVQRIDDLINDELEAFSKWDYPKLPDENDAKIIPNIKVSLLLRKGPDGVTDIHCTAPVSSIGRKNVDIKINDLDCSRKHFSIEIIGGTQAFIRDLASTNGTYLNGDKVSFKEINPGDLIQVGQSIFEVVIDKAG